MAAAASLSLPKSMEEVLQSMTMMVEQMVSILQELRSMKTYMQSYENCCGRKSFCRKIPKSVHWIQEPMNQDDGVKKGLPYENGSEEVDSSICKEVSFAFVSSKVGGDKFTVIRDDGGSLLSMQEYIKIKEAWK